jgi:hypothetical protein
MNGDGLPDLVYFSETGVRVALWNGKSFNDWTLWTSEFAILNSLFDPNVTPRRVIDVNGDGFPDVVDFRSDGVYVGLSNGNGTIYPSTKWTSQFWSNGNAADSSGNKFAHELYQPRHVIDLDGDGVPDILGFGNLTVQWASPHGAAGTRIVGVTDSLGASISFQYTTAIDSSGFYTSATPASVWPVSDSRSPLIVVTQIGRDDGIGGARTWRYRYSGRRSSQLDNGLGFSWMAIHDDAINVDHQTWFRQDYPYIGMAFIREVRRDAMVTENAIVSGCSPTDMKPLCIRSFSVDAGSTIARTTDTWTNEVLGTAGEFAPLNRTFRYISQSLEESWELNGAELPTKTQTFAYEEPRLVPNAKQWGNLTNHGVALFGGFSVSTDRTYEAASDSTWTLGRVHRDVETSVRPALTVTVSSPADAPPPPVPSAAPMKRSTLAIIATITSLVLGD